MGHRPALPGRPVPHDRRDEHGVGDPRALCRARPRQASGGAHPRVLSGGTPVRERTKPACQDGRRAVLPDAERRGPGRRGRRRRRMGRARERLGRGQLRCGAGCSAPRRRTPAPGGRPDRRLLQRRSHRRRGGRRALRSSRRRVERHVPARAGAGLRRPDPVPGRAGPVAREPCGGPRVRQSRRTEGREARGGHAVRPGRSRS